MACVTVTAWLKTYCTLFCDDSKKKKKGFQEKRDSPTDITPLTSGKKKATVVLLRYTFLTQKKKENSF